MSRVDGNVAASLTGEVAQINASRMQAAVKTSAGKAGSMGITDTVEISSKAREMASRASSGNDNLSKNTAAVKKATKVIQSVQSQKMRLVLATGTLLPPGKKTTVNLYS